jgi:hypothetical protein
MAIQGMGQGLQEVTGFTRCLQGITRHHKVYLHLKLLLMSPRLVVYLDFHTITPFGRPALTSTASPRLVVEPWLLPHRFLYLSIFDFHCISPFGCTTLTSTASPRLLSSVDFYASPRFPAVVEP